MKNKILVDGVEYEWRNYFDADPDETGQSIYKDGEYLYSVVGNRFLDEADEDDMDFLANEIQKKETE